MPQACVYQLRQITQLEAFCSNAEQLVLLHDDHKEHSLAVSQANHPSARIEPEKPITQFFKRPVENTCLA